MRVLSISYDLSLLQSRELLVQMLGFDVVSGYGFTLSLAECEKGGFDLMLLGHSIPSADKTALIDCFRQCSRGIVVALLRPNEGPQEGADHSLDASDPRLLLNLLSEITGRPILARHQGD